MSDDSAEKIIVDLYNSVSPVAWDDRWWPERPAKGQIPPETVCARQSGQRCNCAEPCPVAPKKRSLRQKIRQGARKFELNRRGR